MNGLVHVNLSQPFPGKRTGVRKVVSYFVSFNRITFEKTDYYPYQTIKLSCDAGFQGNSVHVLNGNQHIEKLVIFPSDRIEQPAKTFRLKSPKVNSHWKRDENSIGIETGDEGIPVQNQRSINLVLIKNNKYRKDENQT
jgi:hypothetical protein